LSLSFASPCVLPLARRTPNPAPSKLSDRPCSLFGQFSDRVQNLFPRTSSRRSGAMVFCRNLRQARHHSGLAFLDYVVTQKFFPEPFKGRPGPSLTTTGAHSFEGASPGWQLNPDSWTSPATGTHPHFFFFSWDGCESQFRPTRCTGVAFLSSCSTCSFFRPFSLITPRQAPLYSPSFFQVRPLAARLQVLNAPPKTTFVLCRA